MKSNIYSNNGYDFFELKFANKQDLISYVKNAETIPRLLGKKLSSQVTSNADWYKTKSFSEALDMFENGWYEDFDKFLALKKQIDKSFPYTSEKRVYKNYICGSVPNVVNAINNLPLSMRKIYNDNNSQNPITINYNYSYPWCTSSNQTLMNGLLTLSLIDFLESNGYRVNLNFFSIVKEGNQILKTDVILKYSGEKINFQKLYFAFCNPSFFRRIEFRVVETINGLCKEWTEHYGAVMHADEIKQLLNIDKNNIFINWPNEMGVYGKDVKEDIKAYLDTIALGDYIQIDEEKYNVYDEAHVLKKKR